MTKYITPINSIVKVRIVLIKALIVLYIAQIKIKANKTISIMTIIIRINLAKVKRINCYMKDTIIKNFYTINK